MGASQQSPQFLTVCPAHKRPSAERRAAGASTDTQKHVPVEPHHPTGQPDAPRCAREVRNGTMSAGAAKPARLWHNAHHRLSHGLRIFGHAKQSDCARPLSIILASQQRHVRARDIWEVRNSSRHPDPLASPHSRPPRPPHIGVRALASTLFAHPFVRARRAGAPRQRARRENADFVLLPARIRDGGSLRDLKRAVLAPTRRGVLAS